MTAELYRLVKSAKALNYLSARKGWYLVGLAEALKKARETAAFNGRYFVEEWSQITIN